MLTFDDKGGGGRGGRKNPKTCLRNTWMFPKGTSHIHLQVAKKKENYFKIYFSIFQKIIFRSL